MSAGFSLILAIYALILRSSGLSPEILSRNLLVLSFFFLIASVQSPASSNGSPGLPIVCLDCEPTGIDIFSALVGVDCMPEFAGLCLFCMAITCNARVMALMSDFGSGTACGCGSFCPNGTAGATIVGFAPN